MASFFGECQEPEVAKEVVEKGVVGGREVRGKTVEGSFLIVTKFIIGLHIIENIFFKEKWKRNRIKEKEGIEVNLRRIERRWRGGR